MVLNELGDKLFTAISKLTSAKNIDRSAVDTLIQDVTRSLITADIRLDLIKQVQTNLRKNVTPELVSSSPNPRNLVFDAVSRELLAILDPGRPPYRPKRKQTNVFMFVGLQGAGKTTTIAKFAYHYKSKGWRVGMVAADTFRAGAVDQLIQNARGVGVPYYADTAERDPVRVAQAGVEHFRASSFDVVLVDTSGRHALADDLFAEMREIHAAVVPDETILVMDGSIGQAAYPQAKAFHESVGVGSVVITKLDGHARGGGALSAVAATGAPIAFLGVGEKRGDLEAFIPERFVSRLLGQGDVAGLVEMTQNFSADAQAAQRHLVEGQFTFRDMRAMLEQFAGMGSVTRMMEMIPGGSNLTKMMNGSEGDIESTMKVSLMILDSMSDLELDTVPVAAEWTPKLVPVEARRQRGRGEGLPPLMRWEGRAVRVARGSGRAVEEVMQMIDLYAMMRDLSKKTKAMSTPKGAARMAQQMGMTPQQLAAAQQQGPQAMMQMMQKSLGKMAGSDEERDIINQMMGGLMGGGAGGAPNMAQIAQMAQQMGMPMPGGLDAAGGRRLPKNAGAVKVVAKPGKRR